MRMILSRVWDWTCDPAHQWRSHVAHILLALPIALLFGAHVAVFFYFAREVEQALDKVRAGQPVDIGDAIGDIAWLMLALAPVAVWQAIR